MKAFYKFLSVFIFLGYYVACSPVKFSIDTAINKCQNSAQTCISTGKRDLFNTTITSSGGMVDILFINDNSGSMSYEQKNMSDKFSVFIQELDSQSIDYRIGIITTDISGASNPARAVNQNGALQDAKLIKFSNGESFLTQSTSNRSTLFSEAIKRNETAACENLLKTTNNDVETSCPSFDERGVYAANLFVTQNPNSFIRANSHLAIVVLSDEDERSSAYNLSPQYSLETNDLPLTLINNVKSKYANKTMSVHSIIVNPGSLRGGKSAEQVAMDLASGSFEPSDFESSYNPASKACLNAQGNQTIRPDNRRVLGSYGYVYSVLTSITGGIQGDICAGDYGSQLVNIAGNIGEHKEEVQLACDISKITDLAVSFAPTQNQVNYTAEASVLKFNDTVQPGTKITISYSCPTL